MSEHPESKWKNKNIEAWVLNDGSLLIKTRIDKPMDGESFYFKIDNLEGTNVKEHTTH